MFFIFVIWSITYLALSEGILTRNQTVTVTGTTVNAVRNQIASFSAYLNTKNPEKVKAVEETNRKAAAIVEALKNFGVDERDIKVANMSIYRDQNYVDNKYIEGDWNVSVNVEVKLRDESRVNDLTSLLSGLDVDNFYGPNYSVDTVTMDETGLLNAALEDAKTKALSVATAANKKLGKMLFFVEDGAMSNPIYNYRMMGGGGGGAEMLPGTTDVYKSVTVTYELK